VTGTDGERFALAIDLGTGGPKVGLVSLAGRIAWVEHIIVETQMLDHGGAEQDAEEWWRIVVDAARRALGSGAVDPSDVAAVSITGQWASTVPVDADGRPVGPCIVWMDTRGGRHVRRRVGGPVAGYAPRAILRWIRLTGGAPSLSGADPIGHMLHLDHDRPDVASAARWYLEPVDYLSMRFTGVAAASHASMTAAWLTDNRHLDRLEYHPALVRAAGVDPSKLPPLVPTGSVVGTVRDAVAGALGLPSGVQVVAGTPDLHSAAVGTGTLEDFEAHLAVSTTSWISCPVPFKKTDITRQIASVPGVRPGGYVIADNQDAGGLCLQWLRDQVISPDGDRLGFDVLTEWAAASGAGSGGVIFTPWLQGERSPVDDRWARGGFHNVSLDTDRGDLVRAVLEGVALNSRWLLEGVERFVKRRLDPIRIFGGGAQSDVWCQVYADVLDRTIERVAEPLHANLRGAALLAGIAVGAVTSAEVRDLVEVDSVFTPDAATRAVYDRLWAEFPGLHKAQKGMFARLNRPVRPRA
jgi:xylulokinase